MLAIRFLQLYERSDCQLYPSVGYVTEVCRVVDNSDDLDGFFGMDARRSLLSVWQLRECSRDLSDWTQTSTATVSSSGTNQMEAILVELCLLLILTVEVDGGPANLCNRTADTLIDLSENSNKGEKRA